MIYVLFKVYSGSRKEVQLVGYSSNEDVLYDHIPDGYRRDNDHDEEYIAVISGPEDHFGFDDYYYIIEAQELT